MRLSARRISSAAMPPVRTEASSRRGDAHCGGDGDEEG